MAGISGPRTEDLTNGQTGRGGWRGREARGGVRGCQWAVLSASIGDTDDTDAR